MEMNQHSRGAENRLLGKWGEAIVAEELQKRGWRILASGYRCRMGEIDLIVSDGKFLAFVEVKLRKDTSYGTAAERVDGHKQHRILAAAKLYLSQHSTELQPRFDVAEVYAPQGFSTPSPKVHYIENAF